MEGAISICSHITLYFLQQIPCDFAQHTMLTLPWSRFVQIPSVKFTHLDTPTIARQAMDMQVILCCNTLLIQPVTTYIKCTILTTQKKSSIQDYNFSKHSKSTKHTDVANNHSSTIVLNTEPTSYAPLNSEKEKKRRKKKKKKKKKKNT